MNRLFCIAIIACMLLTGCAGLSITSDQNVDDVLKKVAISAGSKALGERMGQAGLVWSDTMERFYKHVSDNGLSVDGAALIGLYVTDNVPELYAPELNELAGLVGFKVTVDGWVPGGEEGDFDNLMVALTGFRMGVMSVR